MGNFEPGELNKIVKSRKGWRNIGPTTDPKEGLLALLQQREKEARTATQRFHALQRTISRLTEKAPRGDRELYFDQLSEDVFFFVVFLKSQHTDRTRALRESGETFLKLNKTTQEVALLETLMEMDQLVTVRCSEDARRSAAMTHFLQIKAVLGVPETEAEEERMEKAVRLARKASVEGKYSRLYLVSKKSAIRRSGRRVRNLAFRPDKVLMAAKRIRATTTK